MNDFYNYLHSKEAPIIIFDGAMGTSLQMMDLTAKDFGGLSLEGCNENLVRTSPKVVEQVHKNFLESGCNVIETNTFGANSIVLEEYGIANDAYELNLKAAQLAKAVITEYNSKTNPIYISLKVQYKYLVFKPYGAFAIISYLELLIAPPNTC